MNILSGLKNNPTESLLKRDGYQIISKNQKGNVMVVIDGREHFGDLRADYTVKKNGRSFVVVTKSGEAALDPTEPVLRRRLIEYDRVFGLNGLLLVDPAVGEIKEVALKYPRERGLDFFFQFFSALFVIAVVVGIIWLMVRVKLF